MKNLALLFLLSLSLPVWAGEEEVPDTVYTGVYITSIHDIDFRQKEYAVNLWLWMKYKNKDFDFIQNLEVPQAKTVTKSFSTIDSSEGNVYILMKLACVMKDSWKIRKFPFDHQRLRLSFENSQFDAGSLIFATDTVGRHFDHRFTLSGWTIDSFDISIGKKEYETAFGDESLPEPFTEYSAYKVKIVITRDAMGLFWKMFLGMYVACLIAFVCFFIHSDSVESRFGLSVGSLFAVIGNKYVIDSTLPETSSFTLVDSLHSISLLFVFCVISCSIYALKLVKKGDPDKARRFDRRAAKILFLIYLLLNIGYIIDAAYR